MKKSVFLLFTITVLIFLSACGEKDNNLTLIRGRSEVFILGQQVPCVKFTPLEAGTEIKITDWEGNFVAMATYLEPIIVCRGALTMATIYVTVIICPDRNCPAHVAWEPIPIDTKP